MVTYNRNSGHTSGIAQIYRLSTDQGATWSDEVVIRLTSVPDPGLTAMENGDLLFTAAKVGPTGKSQGYYQRVTNNGSTFSAITYFTPNPPFSYGTFPPGAQMVIQRNGKLCTALYEPRADNTDTVFLWTSIDDGLTWQKGSEIRNGLDSSINETALLEIKDGVFLAISRDLSNTNTWAHWSFDGGLTWGAQIDYTPQLGLAQGPTVIKCKDKFVLFCRDGNNKTLVSYLSTNGVAWTNKTIINTYKGNPVDGGYSWPMLVGDKIYVVYYAGVVANTVTNVLGRYVEVN